MENIHKILLTLEIIQLLNLTLDCHHFVNTIIAIDSTIRITSTKATLFNHNAVPWQTPTSTTLTMSSNPTMTTDSTTPSPMNYQRPHCHATRTKSQQNRTSICEYDLDNFETFHIISLFSLRYSPLTPSFIQNVTIQQQQQFERRAWGRTKHWQWRYERKRKKEWRTGRKDISTFFWRQRERNETTTFVSMFRTFQ